jgi:hypothetical protein
VLPPIGAFHMAVTSGRALLIPKIFNPSIPHKGTGAISELGRYLTGLQVTLRTPWSDDLKMLTDKIRLSGPDSNDPEDILASSLGVIFPDDITNQHGDRDNAVIYLSPTFGSITLSLAE